MGMIIDPYRFGVPDAIISLTDQSSSTTNSGTYTFSGMNFGSASADRYIAVAIGAGIGSFGGGVAISSVTIGGISATIVLQQAANVSGSGALSGIAIAAVPTGASGAVVVTLGATHQNCAITVYAITGLLSATETDKNSATGANPSSTVNCNAGGVTIGAATGRNGGGTTTWTGLSESSDFALESLTTISSAASAFSTSQSSLAVQATFTVGTGGSICLASFR